jgi:hypothetical protein
MLPQRCILCFRHSSFAPQHMQPQFRLSQRSTHINPIARIRPGTQHCIACCNFANHSKANQNLIPLRRISTNKFASQSLRCPSQPTQKLCKPVPSKSRRQCQAQQKASRPSPHRRNVAGCARQAFPPHRVGGMLSAQKMHAFQKPVASQYRRPSPLRRPQSRIVSNSQCRGTGTRAFLLRQSRNSPYHLIFVSSHSAHSLANVRLKPCTSSQCTVFPSLYFVLINTGLTTNLTKFSILTRANRVSRFMMRVVLNSNCAEPG